MSTTELSNQKAFHRKADAARFWNRVRNPYLMEKESRLADLIANAAPRGACRVLEIGCGEGSNLHHLGRRLGRACMVGVDFSIDKIRFLRSVCPAVMGVHADARGLPFPAAMFDIVFMRDLLHHVNWARGDVLSEAMRVLKPGGTLLVLESNGGTLINRVFRACFPVERGLRDSTPAGLRHLGSRFGEVSLEFVEASLLSRAVGFVLGWPGGPLRPLVAPFYAAASAWERLVERLCRRNRWAYMLLRIRRG